MEITKEKSSNTVVPRDDSISTEDSSKKDGNLIDLTKAADLVGLSQPEVILIKRRRADHYLTKEEK